MAISDVELLNLVNNAKELRTGPQGPSGVGISRVELHDQGTFRFISPTGEKVIIFPRPGMVRSRAARRAWSTCRARPCCYGGRNGQAGVMAWTVWQGPQDGQSTPHLKCQRPPLLGTNDGEVVDCGNVTGAVGATGDRGPAGLPGEPGRDGNTILSGAGAPDNELGKQGSGKETGSENMPMYLKTDAGWRKQTELRHIIGQAPSGASTQETHGGAVA